jgi:hypothetical protein
VSGKDEEFQRQCEEFQRQYEDLKRDEEVRNPAKPARMKTQRALSVPKLSAEVLPPEKPAIEISPCPCGGERFVHKVCMHGRQVICGSCGQMRWQVGWYTDWHFKHRKTG